MESLQSFQKNDRISFCFRKRRFLLFLVAVVGLLLFVFRSQVQQTSSDFTPRWARNQVKEIYGFLHVVLNEKEGGLLSSELDLDLEGYNHVSIYNTKYSAVRWWKERTRIDHEYPVIVFSKSYCPYSKRAKELLASLELKPPPKIIEVDLREDDQAIKKFLSRLTHHSTFPNILIKGKSLGGSDDLANLHSNNELMPLLLEAGVKPQKELDKLRS